MILKYRKDLRELQNIVKIHGPKFTMSLTRLDEIGEMKIQKIYSNFWEKNPKLELPEGLFSIHCKRQDNIYENIKDVLILYEELSRYVPGYVTHTEITKPGIKESEIINLIPLQIAIPKPIRGIFSYNFKMGIEL